MAATAVSTTELTITSSWLKVANGACTIQSISDRNVYSKTFFDVVIGESEPPADTNAFIRTTLSQHANFHQAAPVWLRLNASNNDKDQLVAIIK